jgi:mannose-6-phosphate isomerase-like protein (cupin superfamily)
MSKAEFREVVTIDGKNITLERPASPLQAVKVEGAAPALLNLLNIFDDKYQPENFSKADGSPLRLFDSDALKLDVSKRSKEDMGFWHRNVDYHEIIICVRGALRWETEYGTVTLHPGELILIPKGITHRSMLCEESAEENVLIELKVRDALKYVGG